MKHIEHALNAPVEAFLYCATPQSWLSQALARVDLLLLDHANCEKKAAGTALNLMYRYVDRPALLHRLSRLAREELRHFEQVQALLLRRGVVLRHLSASRYAGGLRARSRHGEPGRLIDTLLIGAIVEARSAERFGRLAAHLDAELAGFYQRLHKAEARHFQDYLTLARDVAGETDQLDTLDSRLDELLRAERSLIETPDTEFRFHSGPLAA